MISKKSSSINQLSIRKLEFEAATLGAELASPCESKMTTTISSKYFWTDSTTKLGWIHSKHRQMYIANSLSKIHENSNPGVWKNSRKYEFRWPRHTRSYPITHTKAMASTTGPSEHTSRLLVFSEDSDPHICARQATQVQTPVIEVEDFQHGVDYSTPLEWCSSQ